MLFLIKVKRQANIKKMVIIKNVSRKRRPKIELYYIGK